MPDGLESHLLAIVSTGGGATAVTGFLIWMLSASIKRNWATFEENQSRVADRVETVVARLNDHGQKIAVHSSRLGYVEEHLKLKRHHDEMEEVTGELRAVAKVFAENLTPPGGTKLPKK